MEPNDTEQNAVKNLTPQRIIRGIVKILAGKRIKVMNTELNAEKTEVVFFLKKAMTEAITTNLFRKNQIECELGASGTTLKISSLQNVPKLLPEIFAGNDTLSPDKEKKKRVKLPFAKILKEAGIKWSGRRTQEGIPFFSFKKALITKKAHEILTKAGYEVKLNKLSVGIQGKKDEVLGITKPERKKNAVKKAKKAIKKKVAKKPKKAPKTSKKQRKGPYQRMIFHFDQILKITDQNLGIAPEKVWKLLKKELVLVPLKESITLSFGGVEMKIKPSKLPGISKEEFLKLLK